MIRFCIALLAACLLIPFAGCTVPAQAKTQPAPQALDLSTQPSDIAQALDRIAESNNAQTRVLLELTKQLSGVSGDIDDLRARIELVEASDGDAPRTSSFSNGTTSTAAVPVTYCTPKRSQAVAYSGPVGLFGGRWAPFRRLAAARPLRRVGWRITHPFGGRFRR